MSSPIQGNRERLEELIGADRIAQRVSELGRRISSDYAGRDLIMVGVLKGCLMFLADLLRRLDSSPTVDFLRVASYGAATETTGVVEIRKDLEISVHDRDVLVVEDIVDTGLTLDYLIKHLEASRPRSLRVCTLLDKRARRVVDLEPHYAGFQIDDEFVVGYGLDFDERHRQLPSICVLRQADDD